MKKALARLALFLFLILAPVAAGEVYVRSLPNAARSKHAFMSAHSGEVDVLVLGSSHTYYGIEPSLLSAHAFSLAQVSQTYDYDCALLRHYALPRLRWVVLPVSYFSLFERTDGDAANWHTASRYELYMGMRRYGWWERERWEATDFKAFAEKMKSLWQRPRMRWSGRGQGREYVLEARAADWDDGAARARANTYGGLPTEQSHLEHIATVCRARRVRLMLVTTPVCPSFAAAEDARQVRLTDSVMTRFMGRHGEVTRLDLGHSGAFTAEDFFDGDHLNTRGARRLTLMVRAAMDRAEAEGVRARREGARTAARRGEISAAPQF